MMKPNLPLFRYVTVFSDTGYPEMIILLVILGLLLCPFILFLKTDYGLRFRAVGLNAHFLEKQGIKLSLYRLMGLFFGTFLCGIAGALVVQLQGYVDVTMGIGMVIHGLAALMLGEALLGKQSLARQLWAPLLGALLYQQMQGFILAMGLAPADLKFFTGVLILLIAGLANRTAKT
jgi:putative ABC transport system permease protein